MVDSDDAAKVALYLAVKRCEAVVNLPRGAAGLPTVVHAISDARDVSAVGPLAANVVGVLWRTRPAWAVVVGDVEYGPEARRVGFAILYLADGDGPVAVIALRADRAVLDDPTAVVGLDPAEVNAPPLHWPSARPDARRLTDEEADAAALAILGAFVDELLAPDCPVERGHGIALGYGSFEQLAARRFPTGGELHVMGVPDCPGTASTSVAVDPTEAHKHAFYMLGCDRVLVLTRSTRILVREDATAEQEARLRAAASSAMAAGASCEEVLQIDGLLPGPDCVSAALFDRTGAPVRGWVLDLLPGAAWAQSDSMREVGLPGPAGEG